MRRLIPQLTIYRVLYQCNRRKCCRVGDPLRGLRDGLGQLVVRDEVVRTYLDLHTWLADLSYPAPNTIACHIAKEAIPLFWRYVKQVEHGQSGLNELDELEHGSSETGSGAGVAFVRDMIHQYETVLRRVAARLGSAPTSHSRSKGPTSALRG